MRDGSLPPNQDEKWRLGRGRGEWERRIGAGYRRDLSQQVQTSLTADVRGCVGEHGHPAIRSASLPGSAVSDALLRASPTEADQPALRACQCQRMQGKRAARAARVLCISPRCVGRHG